LVGPFEENLDPLSSLCSRKIREHSGIIHVGRKDDVRPFLAISDVFVFPSYREGFPNVVLQAGAMELPCIVTDINGSNEIIVSGKNGLIVPIKNTILLEESMETIMINTHIFKELKSNSRKMIETRYQQKNVWNALLEMYKSLAY
jgi:glycosyltransferase involved in cell wall biosynthesis